MAALACTLMLSACASTDSGARSEQVNPEAWVRNLDAVVAEEEANDVGELASVASARGEVGATYGGGQDAAGPRKVFDEIQLAREAAKAEAAELLRQAENLVLAGELVRAEELLERASKTDPSNDAASRSLAEVRQLLGDSQIDSISRDFFDREELARDMVSTEIRNAITLGANAEEAGNYERAVDYYKNALEMARNEPFDLQLETEMQKAQDNLERAEAKRKDQEEKDYRSRQAMIEQQRRRELETSLDYIANQIRELHRRARMSEEDKNFRRAVYLYDQILALNPKDQVANHRRLIAKKQAHIYEMDRLIRKSVENYETAVFGVEQSSIVYQEIFRYPGREEWLRISPKVITIEEIVDKAQSPLEKEVRRKLTVPYPSFAVPEPTPLREVLAELTSLTGLNYFLKGAEGDDGGDTEIKLEEVRNLPLENLLRLILRQVGEDHGFVVSEGAIVIGPRESLREPTYF